MGRRKIDIEMVQDSSSRQVTFSKRRNGIFKKANELATLCAIQIAIVVFSPGGKPFCFGNPTVESVVDRFLNEYVNSIGEVNDSSETDDMKREYNKLLRQLEAEKLNEEALLKSVKEKDHINLTTPVEKLGLEELKKLKDALEELKEDMKTRSDELEVASALLLLAKEPVFSDN